MTSQSKQRLDVFTKFQKSEFVRSGNLDLIIVFSVRIETVARCASKDVFEF